MMTPEERKKNGERILTRLNYPKLMMATLAKLECYNLDAHERALRKEIEAMKLDEDSECFLGSMDLKIAETLLERTQKVLARRAMLRYEKYTEKQNRTEHFKRIELPKRIRNNWQRVPAELRQELLDARHEELGYESDAAY